MSGKGVPVVTRVREELVSMGVVTGPGDCVLLGSTKEEEKEEEGGGGKEGGVAN